MDPFATLEDLKNRLDWTLDPDEERIAVGALEDASELARAYGRQWIDAASAPRMVRTLVLTACTRYMRNPEGYTQSRAGDETLAWSDVGSQAGTVYFTDEERKLLSALVTKTSITSVPITAWGPVKPLYGDAGYVPVYRHPDEDFEKPFPFFADGTSNW